MDKQVKSDPFSIQKDQTSCNNSKLSDLSLNKCHRQKPHSTFHLHHHFQLHKSKMKTTLIVLLLSIARQLTSAQQQLAPKQDPFPGVNRDLASFCAGRPSLPIDLASMVVHVKKNVSFNYKLYLFSNEHVFQTGQVIPRDDFRIHSFPVKFKSLVDFWPPKIDTFQYSQEDSQKQRSLFRVPSETFNMKHFFRPVPLNPYDKEMKKKSRREEANTSSSRVLNSTKQVDDLHGDALPGDPGFISHDVARVLEHRERLNEERNHDTTHPYNENYNSHIEFDRDDQVSVSKRVYSLAETITSGRLQSSVDEKPEMSDTESTIIPVGSFSSFHVNLTYFARKDFGQTEAELIRIQINAAQFKVEQLVIISNGEESKNSTSFPSVQNEDYSFLKHKLIRNPNTRITAINQIYEDWITRNFYTIVYIQRKVNNQLNDDDDEEVFERRAAESSREQVIVNDRLVFRGTSTVLLGAEQLDYNVKAAAFITEKNGLHYYLEFLTTNKFYLCAVDWTKRPFKMIDSRGFPIKATKTQLDNEELLLCPPAVCYSDRPVDEIVGYGRLALDSTVDNRANSGSRANESSSSSSEANSRRALIGSTNEPNSLLVASFNWNNSQISDYASEKFKFASKHLETRLHLRDWTWTLPRHLIQLSTTTTTKQQLHKSGSSKLEVGRHNSNFSGTSFDWHYELARRNDIKVKQDTYGYVLTGHEIDASYRVQNELYLISANHLITINYTLTNETVTSSQPIGEEFFGLSSTLVDPITGAFYDRYQNQVFFFKGDRYIGYNYATKKPLDDFLLEAPLSSMELDPIGVNLFSGGPLVSSLPVVGILGRQHEVDGVYHDLFADFVYIFNGMKFYKFSAKQFKNGTFATSGQSLPRMLCINEHFLRGCNFDRAFPNPCKGDDDDDYEKVEIQTVNSHKQQETGELELSDHDNKVEDDHAQIKQQHQSTSNNFYEEQQMKLRSIAAKRPGNFMNLLLENSLLKTTDISDTLSPDKSANSLKTKTYSQETIFVYLLITMVGLTLIVSLLLIVLIINWSKVKRSGRNLAQVQQLNPAFVASSHYLTNQHQQSPHQNEVQHYSNGGNLKSLSSVKVLSSDNKSINSFDSNIIDNSSL